MEKINTKEESNVRHVLKNKYFWIGITFLLWMVFFDTNSFMTHWKIAKDIQKMESERSYLKKEIAKEKDQLERIHTEPEYLEKLARERFYMKRDNEDLFIVTEEKETERYPKKDE